MKTPIIFGIGIIFLFGLTISAQAKTFSDVKVIHPNYEAIMSLQQKGIVEGYEDGKFRPDQKINRAEFLKIITEALFAKNEIQNCVPNNVLASWKYAFFPDVERDIWYAKYVCTGKMKRYIQGYTDKTFKPENDINYVEALKIIFVANDDLGVQKPQGKEWYAPYLESVNAYYIGLNVDPAKELTRGEMSQLIYNYMSKWKIGQYAETTNTVENGEEIKGVSFYNNEKLNFGFAIPTEWQENYELKTYDMVDDMCGGVTAQIYYFLPKGTDFEFDPNRNQIPLTVMRYKKEEYCTASYEWQQKAIAIYKQNDPTADPMMTYLGAVYTQMRTLQDDKYLYQIYPFQLDAQGSYGDFVYKTDPLNITMAVATFALLKEEN